MNVACVEDEYLYRRMIERFLKELGVQYECVPNPEKLNAVEDFDAFIMDVYIDNDRTAGIDFILKIQKEGRLKAGAVIIFLTNYGRDQFDIPEKLAQIPKYTWMDKPINFSEVENLLMKEKE